MAANPLLELQKFGQSVWYDNIHRGLLKSGAIKKLMNDGEIVGITSNPTIFDKAVSGSSDYDDAIIGHIRECPECDVDCLYEALITEDIGAAAELLSPVYERTNGLDGYVSVEVSPRLANDTESTINEAGRLFSTINRPNVMIKVPATSAGIPAITALIGEGINVNVTLIFGLANYVEVTGAYIVGLEKLAESGGELGKVVSVASFFVSRIDTAVDKQLPEGSSLRGRTAIANAAVAHAEAREIFNSERFNRLREKGARIQRVLWASTSTKDPSYSDVLYVEELIGPDTVNTMPPATIDAYRDHGNPQLMLTGDAAEALRVLEALKGEGVDFEEVTGKLQIDGVESFRKSFDALMEGLASKRDAMV